MIDQPSPNGPNGDRDSGERFAKGNAGGPGNPHARQVGGLRKALLDAITPEDITAVIQRLLTEAKAGNIAAIKEVLDRTLGKPVEVDLIDRLEQIEAPADQARR